MTQKERIEHVNDLFYDRPGAENLLRHIFTSVKVEYDRKIIINAAIAAKTKNFNKTIETMLFGYKEMSDEEAAATLYTSLLTAVVVDKYLTAKNDGVYGFVLRPDVPTKYEIDSSCNVSIYLINKERTKCFSLVFDNLPLSDAIINCPIADRKLVVKIAYYNTGDGTVKSLSNLCNMDLTLRDLDKVFKMITDAAQGK